jgi:biotin transport system substrate-specific component
MNTQHILPVTSVAGKERAPILDAVAVAALITLGAWIRIPLPFTPVPLTLQTLPVLLAAFLVGRNRAMAGALLYMVFGLAGAPVLAVGATFGATFGYLAGFVAAPWVVLRFRRPVVGLIAATLVIYAFGATWLSLYTGHSLSAAVLLGVAPFLPGDALKAAVAYGIIRGMQRSQRRG